MHHSNNSDGSRKIRVVHLTYSLHKGGCESLQVEFAKLADQSRFDLRFVAVDSLGHTADVIEELGWPVTCLEKPGGFRPGHIFKLAKLLRQWGTDVVHTHDNGPLMYGSVAGRLAGVPVLVHTRHHGRLPWIAASKVSSARMACYLVDRVCCVSKDSLTEGIKEGIPESRLCTVWNGIDTTRFTYDPERRGNSGPMASIACLRPDKNTESLIRATATIIREEPEFLINIAGDGPPERVAMLKQLAIDLKVDKNVIFLGNVNDVPSLLARSSVMVLPSTTEGISIALLEAMACGVPVIATNVGGNPEVVEDGVTGILVPANDDAAMTEALLRMYRSPEMRKAMGAAGRVKVVRDFEIRRMVSDYENLYVKHLGQRRGSFAVEPTASATTFERATPVGVEVESG
jgi:glycosyltransferase involved in cell wall biosynthesis